ncbi:MAG: phosphoribosylformylglycinamidine synthase subunit PurL, partial [Chitinophagales bacterium]|nr:phosphoribosylformylglycinamidine synthase subunit PurL [Chitinophagales bacterium]
TLPRKGEHLLVEAGEENAGLVDLGDGMACAFKIESHNHPSAIEPYQGAATGVGGIHRDIFTMGARPIAALNSLRFGRLSHPKTQHLIKGVVKGIGDYGNCFGVPTVGGEVYFDHCYQTNPLVNAMSVGIVDIKNVVSAISKGEGNPIYIVGSSTGKDGIHGATFASADIDEDSSEKLPSVQVGDPFQEKLLLEASLEAIQTGAIVGMQDMGAAGIACSTSEMSAKGEHGMNIYLDKVPMRQKNMKPFELLLSESQERMLIVVKKGREKDIERVFEKWDLNCEIIGEVTKNESLNYYMHGELVACLNAHSLVLGGGAPVYERDYKEAAYYNELRSFDINSIEQPKDLITAAEKLVSQPNIASKRWVYEQYDSMVGIANTTINNPSDAAIIRIPDSEKMLAVTVDCNSRFVWADPYVGAMMAVSEAARNITCSGGTPAAITNCLNFGNPYNPEVYWQFVNAIKGMGAACEKFNTPVTGGNVSFYNQSEEGGAVFPTPTIGMMGVLDSEADRLHLNFDSSGDLIYILGQEYNDISSSQYLVHIHNVEKSPAPHFDLDNEFQIQEVLRSLNTDSLIKSAHDISEGGLFTCLIEACFQNKNGFEISCSKNIRKDAFLFGEAASRIVVSVDPSKKKDFENYLNKTSHSFQLLGNVTGGEMRIDGDSWGEIGRWQELYDSVLEGFLNI